MRLARALVVLGLGLAWGCSRGAPSASARYRFDGVGLGQPMTDLIARVPAYGSGCEPAGDEDDAILFVTYQGLPCLGAASIHFPAGTSAMFFLDKRGSRTGDQYHAPIRAVAWLGGRYFDAHSNFPVPIGATAAEIDKAIGPPVASFAIEAEATRLTVRRHRGDTYSILDARDVAVGYAVGAMPGEGHARWHRIAVLYATGTPH